MGGLFDNNPRRQFKRINAEREIVRTYLSNKIESANMASQALNITRPNMCRHIRKLQKSKLLFIAGMGICKVTGRKVYFVTCISNLLIKAHNEIKKT
jgi:hypothetical protein